MEKVDWIVGLSGEKLGQKRGKMDQEIKAGKNLLSSFVTLDSAFKLPHKVLLSNYISLRKGDQR